MTPKEKAKELVDKYDETLTYLESRAKAKQCALIAVEEILLSSPTISSKSMFFDDLGPIYEPITNIAYWQQVKQEIEKL